MDTKFPVVLVLSIGLAVLIFQLSGAAFFLENTTEREYASGNILENQNNASNVNNESAYGGNIGPDSDSNIVGVVLGSIPRMLGLLAIPGVIGSEIQVLTPAPWWIAQPVGMFFNVIVYIGGFQIATGRVYE